ncbi:MAG: SpoIIE family protein phosphatase [Actinomycetota bacterium]|nr:SpoIIE family protein phosphatase [Actinomycetota bacterium]
MLAEGGLAGTAADEGEERVAALVREANRRVFQRASEDAATFGMGTTMTVALVDSASGTIVFGHVGDSRAYRIRDGELEQLTQDHSLVGELVRSGKISPEEAETHPQRSVITRALGTEAEVDVDTFTVEAQPDDVYLLCSDGLTDMLADREILSLVDGAPALDAAARRLVEAANSRGGEDNITVVVFEIVRGNAEDTVTMPAASNSEPAPEPEIDEEDTLSGLERVPAVDTAVVSAEEIAQQVEREQEPDPRRRSILPLLLLVLALAGIAVLVVWGLYR